MNGQAQDKANIQTRAGRREWIGLAVLALPTLLISMDVTVLYLAVPELSRDLAPSSSQLLWITDIYGFLIAASLITMGTLGDRIGRRRLLLIGGATFAGASVLAAFSTSPGMLIAARALLGVAGATLMPSTLSLIRTMFDDPRQRTTAIGVWVTSLSLGVAIGPIAGGLLLEQFWWGSVFLLSVPVMGLLLAAGPRLLPEFRDPDAGRLDLASAALSGVAVLAAVYGIKRIAESGLDLLSALSIVAGLGLGVAFLHRQRRVADPLIDLRLFRAPGFNVSLAANTLALLILLGTFFFFAQYLQLVLGHGPLEAGLWLLPYAGGFIVGSMLASLIVRRVAPGFVIAGGLALAAVGFAILAQIEASSGVATLVAGSVVTALGLAPVLSLSTDMIVGAAPPERAGAAAAISETGSELGGALGVAILGSVATAIYRGDVTDALPADAPPAAAEAARDSLGGAVEATGSAPAGLSPDLLGAAQDAFVDGLQVVATISAAIALTVAIVTAGVLRRTRGAHARSLPPRARRRQARRGPRSDGPNWGSGSPRSVQALLDGWTSSDGPPATPIARPWHMARAGPIFGPDVHSFLAYRREPFLPQLLRMASPSARRRPRGTPSLRRPRQGPAWPNRAHRGRCAPRAERLGGPVPRHDARDCLCRSADGPPWPRPGSRSAGRRGAARPAQADRRPPLGSRRLAAWASA
jgi:DHA2 family multidrug resistance protein-like MFS transporter